MTSSEIDIGRMIAEADAKGKELEAVEARNRKRRAKGRKPLLDPQEREDEKVSRRRYRTGDQTTVEGADAIKLFELRKSEMANVAEDDMDVDDDGRPEEPAVSSGASKPTAKGFSKKDEKATEKAIREAEAARRVQDLKNGRIDHSGNWSDEGQNLGGGDPTRLVDRAELGKAWGLPFPDESERNAETDGTQEANAYFGHAGLIPQEKAGLPDFGSFAKDLYRRLGVSFDAIERTLSELQGRVAEIVTASAKNVSPEPDGGDPASEFEELLSRKTPVVFDVGGTKMTFDAITVFYAPPCITLVSKIGSAKITPKPGAQLLLSYEADGRKYVDDPVTFLGTRFDLPMFGLSFVGFIRDVEADMLDAEPSPGDM